jgi:hypothetical protein
MLKQVTREEYNKAIDLIPEHDGRIRQDFHPNAFYYFQAFAYSEAGELLAWHAADGTCWVSPTIFESKEKFRSPHEVHAEYLKKMQKPAIDRALESAADRLGITPKEVEERDNKAYRDELRKDMAKLKKDYRRR